MPAAKSRSCDYDSSAGVESYARSVLDNLDREEPAALNRLFKLLAIPSISTDPAFHEACIEAAEACANALGDIGFKARVEPTLG